MIAFAQPFAASEVGFAVVIKANHDVDPTLLEQEDFVPGTHVAIRQHHIAGTQHLPQLAEHSHFAVSLACVRADG